MVKKIAIVSLDPRAGVSYGENVKAVFGRYVDVKTYSVSAGTVADMEPADLYMMSTDAFENRADVPLYIPIDAQVSEIYVSYFAEEVERLRAIPAGTRALFVNLTEKMVREATSGLNQLGINHIQFVPFYPGADPETAKGIELAITPDEERYVPAGVKTVINIGQRCPTSGTMIEAALRLGLESILETEPFRRYCSRVMSSTYTFDMMFARSRRLESQFDILMEILDEGIIGVNERAEIFAINKKAQEITGLEKELVLHKQAQAVVPNLPLRECLLKKKTIEPKIVRMGEVNVAVSAVPVLRNNECIGAFATLQRFSDSENRQIELRGQLMHKGYRAKYSFEDVLGKSEEIRKTKEILSRMARTDSPVLLIGETGTGKELFAHAVHLASRRAKGPFVALNCGAMPENLLESELFGYEEGAYTGAKRGGKPGLFEFAHKGTLFLDEVEGMSQALQVKLLRVLQEHEIMRVGGNRIISVDVRIVAATNESLEKLVREGSFRRDLYYRLNTLPVVIPPLRQRGEDVFLLLERFEHEIREHEGGGESFTLSEEVKQLFCRYNWPGNIRELRNVAEYLCFTGSTFITVKDLPPTFTLSDIEDRHIEDEKAPAQAASPHSHASQHGCSTWQQEMENENVSREAYIFVLRELCHSSENGHVSGRDCILQAARDADFCLSQIQVRTILNILNRHGLAIVKRGRGGSRITAMGREAYEILKSE